MKINDKTLFYPNYYDYIYILLINTKQLTIMKNIKIDYAYLTAGVAALIIAILTLRGTIQEYIHFTGTLNEIGFCMMAILLSVSCFFCSFTKVSK